MGYTKLISLDEKSYEMWVRCFHKTKANFSKFVCEKMKEFDIASKTQEERLKIQDSRITELKEELVTLIDEYKVDKQVFDEQKAYEENMKVMKDEFTKFAVKKYDKSQDWIDYFFDEYKYEGGDVKDFIEEHKNHKIKAVFV